VESRGTTRRLDDFTVSHFSYRSVNTVNDKANPSNEINEIDSRKFSPDSIAKTRLKRDKRWQIRPDNLNVGISISIQFKGQTFLICRVEIESRSSRHRVDIESTKRRILTRASFVYLKRKMSRRVSVRALRDQARSMKIRCRKINNGRHPAAASSAPRCLRKVPSCFTVLAAAKGGPSGTSDSSYRLARNRGRDKPADVIIYGAGVKCLLRG